MLKDKKAQIKNIIFDLGGVILNIDPNLTVEAMRELGVENFEKAYSLASQNDLFDRLETGKVSPDIFRDELRVYIQKDLSDDVIDNVWGKLLLDFPKERIDLIKDLKNRYRLFLLSNTNIIHYHMYNNDLKTRFGIELNELFEKAYYSHEVGLRKPDAAIYEFVVNDSKLKPEETLFIDDSKVNAESASSLGIIGYHLNLNKKETITEILNSF